jgi:transaldolase
VDALAARLQHDGAEAFVKSWQQLLQRIADKSASLDATPPAAPAP